MSDSVAAREHRIGYCCIVAPECLQAVRRYRMLSFEDIIKKSGFTREYLAGVERGDKNLCVNAAVLRAYEDAGGNPIEQEVLGIAFAYVEALVGALNSFNRLYHWRYLDPPPR